MYYGKKKAMTIAIVVIILILVLGAVGAFLMLSTDTFKSPQELFFKYIGQAIEDFDFEENTQISGIGKLMKQKPYTIESSLEAKINSEDSVTQNIYNNGINQSRLQVSTKVNEPERKLYAKGNLFLNNKTIFEIQFARTDDMYAAFCDEVVTAYVGVENKNLKDLAKKITNGIDTKNIPNEVEVDSYNDLFEITDAEKEHIYETYMQVLKDNLDSKSFSKETEIATVRNGVTYNTTGYRLNLTDKQYKDLQIAVLQALSQDSITLNLIATKAKIVGMNEQYTEINLLTQTINRKIAEIKNAESTGNGVSIIVYVDNGKVITTEIIFKNQAKYTIYTIKDALNVTRNLLIENLSESEEFSKIEINETERKTETGSSINVSYNKDNNYSGTLYINNVGNKDEEYLNSEIEATYSTPDTDYEISYKQELNFVENIGDIVTVNQYNSGILNYYEGEELRNLITLIQERIKYLVDEKTTLLGIDFSDGNVKPKINDIIKEQQVNEFNSKFDGFVGTISGSAVKNLVTVINNNNKDTKNKNVILMMDGINMAGNNSIKTDNNKNYTVEMVKDNDGYITQINVTTEN